MQRVRCRLTSVAGLGAILFRCFCIAAYLKMNHPCVAVNRVLPLKHWQERNVHLDRGPPVPKIIAGPLLCWEMQQKNKTKRAARDETRRRGCQGGDASASQLCASNGSLRPPACCPTCPTWSSMGLAWRSKYNRFLLQAPQVSWLAPAPFSRWLWHRAALTTPTRLSKMCHRRGNIAWWRIGTRLFRWLISQRSALNIRRPKMIVYFGTTT